MLRQIIGTTATTMLARQIGGVAAGPAGALLSVALPFAARRLGPLGMVGMAVGAWAINRVLQAQANMPAPDKTTVDAAAVGRTATDAAAKPHQAPATPAPDGHGLS